MVGVLAIFAVVAAMTAGGLYWVGMTRLRHGNPARISALFVGNSFTSANDLPKTVSLIAGSLGNHLDYDMSAPGGYFLMQHASDTQTLDKIRSKPWDFVVLQDQSQAPAQTDAYTDVYVLPYAAQLNDLIHKAHAGTKTVFFETWGYKNGDAGDCARDKNICDYAGMQKRLDQTYYKMAQAADGKVAPVGDAWSIIKQGYPAIDLYQNDGKHPSPEGTYLAACVFYTTLFGKNVIGASHLTIDPQHAKILQEVAQEIATNK